MPTKRLVVLANSVKKGGHCVAGREVLNKTTPPQIGEWVRPVSQSPGGTLTSAHCAIGRGSATPLDILDIPVLTATHDAGQPENWRIDERQHWTKVGEYPLARVAALTETPFDLWRQPGERVDRIPVDVHAAWQPQASIVLIQPRGLLFRLARTYNAFKGHEQLKSEAQFEYAGHRYVLHVTDPEVELRHCWVHPERDAEPVEARLPGGDNCRLCVSLTPPWEGYHYKVVACVLELP